jgi:hypothetical protein
MSRLSADEVSFFKEYGYLLKSNVLDPELCARARDQLWATATPPLRRDEPRTWTGPIEPQHETEELSGHHWFPHADHAGGPDDIRQQLVTRNEQVLCWARQLLGEDNVDLSARARSRGIICNLPVAEQRRSLNVGVVPNTDDGLGYERCHNDGHGMHLGVVGLLDDVDMGGGATMIWPASHRRVFHLYSQQCMNARQACDGATITRQQAFSDGLQEEDSAFGAEMRRLNLDTRAKKRPPFFILCFPFLLGKTTNCQDRLGPKLSKPQEGEAFHTHTEPVDTYGTAGSVLLWHHRTGHTGTVNRSSHIRQARKRPFWRHFTLRKDQFTKTGPGQPQEKLRKEWRLLHPTGNLLRFLPQESREGGAGPAACRSMARLVGRNTECTTTLVAGSGGGAASDWTSGMWDTCHERERYRPTPAPTGGGGGGGWPRG